MAQRRYNTDMVNDQALALREENRQKAAALSKDMRSFYDDCETYFLTSAPGQPAIYQELSKLIERLQIAELRQISAEEVLGMSGEDYCKLTLRRLNIARYDFDIRKYIPSVVAFVLLTLTIYATYMFIAGYAWWGDFASAIQMPVAISGLGLPLQIFVIFSALFFWVQFRRNTSFGRKWYQDFNILYLFSALFASVLVIFLPYVIHNYRVAQFNLPVWFIWFIDAIFLGYYILSEYFNVGDKVDDWISNRVAKNNTAAEDAPIVDTYMTGQTTASDDTPSPVKEAERNNDEANGSAVSDEPMRLNNLWNTLMLKRPILNRKTYREMQERQEKEDHKASNDKKHKK